MDILSRAQIIKYHNDAINKHGINSIEALGWKDRKEQQVRFETLINPSDLSGHTVLDVGCGTGDLLGVLSKGSIECEYTGIDHMAEFVKAANEKYKNKSNACFLLGDFSTVDLGQYDYIIASGSLNYKTIDPHFIYKMIARFYSLCKVSFVFNLLDTVEFVDRNLVMHDKAEILAFCRKLSPDVVLKDNYIQGDFCIRMNSYNKL